MPATLESRRFGSVPVTEEDIVRFAEGLPGFEELREFLFVRPEDLAPVQFLVSCENPEICFPILAVQLCLPGYAPRLDPAQLEALGVADPAAVEWHAILTFHQECEGLTANLRAPVLINPSRRIGRQVTLTDSTYSLRHSLVGG
ncbi:MAG TPA: flagellar assembly protein FliW [Candidatus Acidoferrum sp.]|nr:flagellar assembly protein FliW [Candidatus Acidoferrum sp.]